MPMQDKGRSVFTKEQRQIVRTSSHTSMIFYQKTINTSWLNCSTRGDQMCKPERQRIHSACNNLLENRQMPSQLPRTNASLAEVGMSAKVPWRYFSKHSTLDTTIFCSVALNHSKYTSAGLRTSSGMCGRIVDSNIFSQKLSSSFREAS